VLAAAGVDVTAVEATGNSRAVREDQLAGLIDLTWETTGTGWLDLLREIGPSADPDQLYRDVRDEDLDENGIVWLPPAPADAGVGVVADPEAAEDLGIATLSDLAATLDEQREDVAVCVSSPRSTLDPDGLAALAEAAGVRIRTEDVSVFRDRRLFELIDVGLCPFALVDRLDPRLADLDVELLEDDLGAFVAQQPAITVREDTDELAPGLAEVFEPVAAALDTETLRELLSRVVDEGDTPDQVARDWLVDEGFAEQP
jgi:osmoprotectant transport system substrate-binding protein